MSIGIRWFRFFAYVTVFFSAVIMLLPLVCGYWLEQRINKDIYSLRDWLSLHNLGHIHVELYDYQRGWLKSDYSMRIGWKDSPQRFSIENQLHHGPLPWYLFKQGDWHPYLAAGQSSLDFSEAQWPFVMPKLSFESVVDFAGNVDVDWRFLGYRNEHEQGHLDVASSKGQLHYAKSEKRVYGEFTIPDLRLGLSQNRVSLSGLTMSFDFSQGDSVLPVGALSIGLEAGRSQRGKQEIRLSDLEQKVQLSEFDRLSNVQWLLEVGNWQSPTVQLTQVSWDSILRGISEISLTVLQPEQAPSSFTHLLKIVWNQVVTRTPELLSGTEFEIAHFEAIRKEGAISGFLRTQVPSLDAVVEMAPKDLLKEIDLSAELSVPRLMLHEILADSSIQDKFQLSEKYRHLKRRLPAEQLNALAEEAASQQLRVVVAQGLLRQEQDQYWSSIELKDGSLSFNGHKVHGF